VGVGASGKQQWFTTTSAVNRDSYIDSINHLESNKLNNGLFLVNRKTANEFLKFSRDEAGGDLSERMWVQGREAISEGKILKIPHIFTIKRELVPDYRVYQFTTPDFLGRAYVLEDTTMYVEKKKDILRFSAVKKLGMTICNTGGCAIQDFLATSDNY
jgi:hypothetical protein